ncbi:HNH endonuclease family protein [Curtobacterium caseinilyticum]|uniref:HNH endonuclease family protein n=1 Tax=Curtobacterium caseinilyticum TaxID=3055137 RepID=A0ABT7TPH2_9MICO|nr:HNH endonuclease family protein [Curtobacterium caseinilyticum]MDM7891420.1 HNH endonuclease family protein [Curtobacterium caseinilyticum]
MTSRRRRPRSTSTTRTTSRRRTGRSTLASLGVLAVAALAAYLLHVTGVTDADADAVPDVTTTSTVAPTISADPTTSAAPTPSAAPTTSAGGGAGASSASRPAGGDERAAAAARRQLAALPVKGKAPATGYDREARFGTGWLDVDHNGCDTRNDVLARDLTAIERQGPCKVLRGTLVSPYTGERIDFVRGNRTSTLVQIDHVVALENAWRTGAQQLTQTEREALANDPTNLFAVDGHSNAQKRSGDAATWLPAETGFRCTYVEHQVAVKTTYRLWVAPAERDAMARVLDRC